MPRIQTARAESQSGLELLAEQSTRMIEVFKTRKRVPVSVIDEFERMEQEMETLRGEIGRLDDRIGELESGAHDVGKLREMLAPFVDGMAGASLQERKAVIQGLVGEIRVEPSEPKTGDGDECRGGSQIRTRRLVVNIGLRAPSSPGRRPHTCAVIPCWGDLNIHKAAPFTFHHGRPAESVVRTPSPLTEPRKKKPRETPEQRAIRFHRMLQSGQVSSRSELARRLGCSRAWVTQALRHLPGSS